MLKVGVLLGGKSIEREVSFNSGRTVCDHLDTNYFQVVPIFQRADGELFILPWSFLYRGKISDFEHRLEKEAEKIDWQDISTYVDFVYIATHGQYAEDGRLQATLELFKIPYLGTKVFGSSLAMNKQLHNDFLHAQGIATPRGFCLSVSQIKSYNAQFVAGCMKEKGLRFPVVVKPQQEGSSLGIFVVKKEELLQEAIEQACFIAGSKGQGVLIEEKIEGMEFTSIIITDPQTGRLIAFEPTEILLHKDSEIFDYKQKYMPGMVNERTPAHCSKEHIALIKDTAIKAMKALEFSNLARIDGFLTKDGRIVIIDSNPLSGMGPATFLFRQAAESGMGHAELINVLIKAELKNYKMMKKAKPVHMKNRKKIAVLFGGASHEREVSLDSGRNVCYKLSPEKYEVIPVFVDDEMKLHILDNKLLVHTSTREIKEQILKAKPIKWTTLNQIADFAFLALHGGQGENGVVQGWLEMLGMPYNGSSVFTSALCMDKFKTGQFLKIKGFDTPVAQLVEKIDWQKNSKKILESMQKTVGFPCIVKPHDDGCSVMVYCVHDQDELKIALQDVLSQKNYALVEEKVVGTELTVGVIGNESPRAFVPSETILKKEILSMEEKFLPGVGENQTPARLSSENIQFVKDKIVNVFKAINGVGYMRIDCFFQDEKQSSTGEKCLVVLECNSLPALTPATCLYHQAAEEGMRPMELLDEIIQLGFAAHAQQEVVSVDAVLEKQDEITRKQKRS